MDCVVLGAGPVGLVSAYLLEADAVVSEGVGGTLRRFAPIFLRRTESTETFLDDLGIPVIPRIVRFGFLGDDGARAEADSADLATHFRRSRGLDPGSPIELSVAAAAVAAELEVETFDLSIEDLVAALVHHVDVTVGRAVVVEICRTDGRMLPKVRVAVAGGRELWTRQLINTLPAPEFDAISRHHDGHNRAAPRDWPGVETTFVRVPLGAIGGELRRARDELGLSVLRVVSVDRERFAYDRVTFFEDVAVLEFNRPGSAPTGGTWDALERFCGRVSAVGPSRDPVEYAGTVWHVGRLARWSNEVMLHNVIEELYEHRDGGAK